MKTTTAERLKKLRHSLSKKGVAAILISQPENRRYLSGFSGSAGYLLITQDSQILATDFRYVEQVKREAPDYRLFQLSGDMSAWFPRLIEGLGLNELGFEAGHMTIEHYNRLKDIVNPLQIKLVPLSGMVESLRAVKEPGEVELIKRAIAISDAAIEHAEAVIGPGMTELGLAWEIERHMREHGSQSLPFEVIVAAGPNSALPHAQPSPRPIKEGEPVVIDIGARAEGYTSDLTRTLCLGERNAKFNQSGTVLKAQLEAEEGIRSGLGGAKADTLARTVIEQAGYAANFGHGLGHGLGLVTHESPRLGPGSKDILKNGMVFTVEPGIYLPGWGGVRIEDTVLLENGRIKVLSQSKK